MANEGKRCYCRCIEEMTMIIGKEELIIFAFKEVYPCMIRTSDTEVNYYKIYGNEFALSCSESEFNEHFKLLKNQNYDRVYKD